MSSGRGGCNIYIGEGYELFYVFFILLVCVKLVTIIIYMYIVYISLIDKCELMTFILYTCIVSKVMIG